MTWGTFWLAKMGRFASVAKSGSRRHKQRNRSRLLVEPLEDRCLLTTITPTTFADGVLGSGSLRDAVLQFNADTGTADDTIQLVAGTYTLTIQNTHGHESAGLEGDLDLTQTSHHWIIQGAGSSTIIDASQLHDRVFQIVNPGTQVVFQNLVIQGGLAQDNGTNGALPGTTEALGGGIFNNGGNVTLDHVVVQNNMALGGNATARRSTGYGAGGAGIYSAGGALTIAGTTIANNTAIGGRGGDSSLLNQAGAGGWACGGGLYAASGSLDISDSRIANNPATGGRGGDGALIYTTSGARFFGGTGGTALGGGLYVTGSSLTVASSTIASNQATGGSGGLYGYDGVGEGGGLCTFSNAGTPTVTGTTLSGNSASAWDSRGGAISNEGLLMVSSCTLSGNSASSGVGGGIYNNGTLTVSSCTLSGNSAIFGGGISNDRTLTVSSSTLSGNSATEPSDFSGVGGGAIYSQGTATVTNSTLSGNSASGPYTVGGGIDNGGTLTVSNSTLSSNSADYWGGGIITGGTLTVSNSTLSGNSAANGGGIYAASTLTVSNSTLSGNRAVSGGGGIVSFGSALLHNTLIAGNFRGATGTTRSDVSGTADSGGDYNLIGDGTGMIGLVNGVNGNLVGSAAAPLDPLLGPLQNNGGPTFTQALLAGSPALNAGNPNQLGVADQRGVIRAGGVNIGAYQASASAFVVTVSGAVASGTPFDVTVQAVDVFGQVAFGYRGTVTFSVTDPDPAVVLPADYTFRDDDHGTHTFTGEFTLFTPGVWTLTAADLFNGLTQDVILTVNP